MFNELIKNVMNLGIITEDDVKRLTSIELMLLIIERSNGLLEYLKSYIKNNDSRVDQLDKKYQQITDDIKERIIDNETYFEEVIKTNLSDIALNQMNDWLTDGTLESLINETALKNINDHVTAIDERLTTLESTTNSLVDKNNRKMSVNVKDFGAIGDGIADDTNAFKTAFSYDNIEIPSGVYRVTDTISFENKNVTGSNMTHVTILGDIENPDIPILAVGGQSVIRDITVAYAEGRITGGESLRQRIGIQLYGGYRDLPFQTGAGIYNCQVDNCGTGISDGGASVFSANFKDIRISKFTCRGMEMTGTARTGNVYDNIYITNHAFTRSDGTGDTQKAWQGFVMSGEESECTITQLNIEHATLYQAVIIEDVLGLNAGSIHIEGVEPRDNWGEYIRIVRTQGKIDAISFYYTRHKVGTSLIKFAETKKVDTENDFYSSDASFEIGTLVCKGLNRPDRSTYGYEPNYPVSASTLSGDIQPFYFINREASSDKYYVALNQYNWMTYSYGYNDKEKYEEFSCNPHGSIIFTKKANMGI